VIWTADLERDKTRRDQTKATGTRPARIAAFPQVSPEDGGHTAKEHLPRKLLAPEGRALFHCEQKASDWGIESG